MLAVVCACVSRVVMEMVDLQSPCVVSGHTALSHHSLLMTIKTVVYNTTRHCSGSLIADCQRSRVGTFERRIHKAAATMMSLQLDMRAH